MTIRFRCSSCDQRLRVGDQKAGRQLHCPNCRATITIPTATERAAKPAAAPAVEAPPVITSKAPGFDFDAISSAAPAATESSQRPAAGPVASFDPHFVSLPRRLLYAQGVLIAGVALIAFLLGYLMAGGGGSANGPPAAAAPTGPVQITGRLTYTEDDQSRADRGAVIIVLPVGSAPDEKIAVEGLRPDDPTPQADDIALRALRSLGGEYVRSDETGSFTFAVPTAGEYHVLLLSGATERLAQVQPRPEDLAALGGYFEFAPDLLAGRKYHWELMELSEDRELLHDFGPSGR